MARNSLYNGSMKAVNTHKGGIMCKLFSAPKFLAIGSIMLASAMSPSFAANISFGGVAASDGSGLTSQYMDPITGATVAGNYLIETFDAATGVPGFPGSTEYTKAGFENECAVNSINNSPLGVSVTANPTQIGIRKGSVKSVAAAPAGDTTCYGYLTNNGSGVATAVFDYTPMLAFFDNMYSDQAPFGITYLGFYWGSVDTYNSFKFYSGEQLVSSITGEELLTALQGSAGDRESASSNTYVNIDFSLQEQFDKLVITTSGIAGEFDNLVVGITGQPIGQVSVPAPSAILLFALGMVGIGYTRAKRK